MTTPLPLNEAHVINDASGHVQAHNDITHYVNKLANPAGNNALLGESFDGRYANGSFAPTAGTVYLAKILTPVPITITNVVLQVATAGTGATALANCFVGVYSSAGNQLGISADQSSSWATNGNKVIPLTATLAITGGYGTYVYVACLVGTQSTTTVKFAESSGAGNSSAVNFNQAGPPFYAATSGTGLTALPSTVTLASSSALTLCGIS